MISSIVLIGAPGSGKTEISKVLAKQTGYNYISSGDIARKMALNDVSVNHALMNGEMAPEEMMREHLGRSIVQAVCRGGMILDGCPRSIDQYKWLSNIIPSELTVYVHIDTNLSVCRHRLISRMRNDDVYDIINTRLAYYTQNIMPMICKISQTSNFVRVSNNYDYDNITIDVIGQIAYEIREAVRHIENSKDRSIRLN